MIFVNSLDLDQAQCLICFQAAWHPDVISEILFWNKSNVEKYLQMTKKSWKITQRAKS